ncbi:glycosyltransferase [Geothrix terrae]|uniref:glycosyltransferase n=1 Tax=Geothrix terrae TaxID=2922720 RepID=UPI001FAE44A0|nr:glycosyltransferase [Geothrix terrae]
MSRQPLISIALCTYNGAPFLAKQLDSLLAQDWENLEIVAVDDGSTDGTRDILMDYLSRDKRISVYFNEKNLGFLLNFEKALTLTKGAFIAPCDQDDWWCPTKLKGLHDAIGDHALAYCDSLFMSADGRSLEKRASDVLNMYQGHDPAAFVFSNCISGHAMLIRRSLMERALPFPAGCFHDWWLAFVAVSTEGVVFVPEPWVHYRQHAAAQTDLSGRSRQQRPQVLRLLELSRRRDLISAMADYPSSHRPYFKALLAAWDDWQESWMAPRLVSLLLQRRDSLYFINLRASKRPIMRALRFLWGLKLKRLLNPRRYGHGPKLDTSPMG